MSFERLDTAAPSRASMRRAARLADIAYEEWMQDWPVEVSDPQRLGEFVGLLLTHREDEQLAYWFVNLVLDSANSRDDLHEWEDILIAASTAVWRSAPAPAIAEAFEYWACSDATDPDEFFPVTFVAREVLRRIDLRTDQP